MPAFTIGGWVDARIRNAIDHLVDQVDTPDSSAAKAVAVLADAVGDRVDQSLDKVPGLVDKTGDAVREDVRQALDTMTRQLPDIGNAITTTLRQMLPGDLWGRLDRLDSVLGGRRMTNPDQYPANPRSEYTDPDGGKRD